MTVQITRQDALVSEAKALLARAGAKGLTILDIGLSLNILDARVLKKLATELYGVDDLIFRRDPAAGAPRFYLKSSLANPATCFLKRLDIRTDEALGTEALTLIKANPGILEADLRTRLKLGRSRFYVIKLALYSEHHVVGIAVTIRLGIRTREEMRFWHLADLPIEALKALLLPLDEISGGR